MAFIFDAEPSETFFYEISIPEIIQSGGTVRHKLDIFYKRLSRKEIIKLEKAIPKVKEGDDEDTESQADEESVNGLERDADYIMDIVCGWKVKTRDGADIPFNRENLVTLLDKKPAAARAIIQGFFDATMGGGAARKN